MTDRDPPDGDEPVAGWLVVLFLALALAALLGTVALLGGP